MRREIEFVRHVPPRQIARRLVLAARRRVEGRWKPRLDLADAVLAESAPGPLFSPRPSATARTSRGWSFTFLNRTAGCGPAIDWSLPGPEAADQLWSMNLHYFEHAEGLPDAEWGELVRQWTEAHPPYAPGSTRTGWNAYALSLRVVSWLQQLQARRDRLDPALAADIARSVAAQLHYLERHLETDIGGNHLFKNIAALLWGSAALECHRSKRWYSLGLRLLRRELGQFLSDGMQYERSPSYHAQTIADCLGIRWALGQDPTGGRLDKVIRRGLQVAVDLTHADGLPALFGDAGLHMAYAPDQICAAAARMGFELPAPQAAFSFPEAGYFGLRSGADVFIVDAGPLGPDTLPGHAHGDMFAFEWSVGGERVIVDQGVFEYVAGARRHGSRSAASHNTVAAPGADQGDFFDAFRLGKRTRLASRTATVHDETLVLEACHDGLVGPARKVTHRRRIEAGPRRIRVTDRLSRPLDGASASLLLAPQAKPTIQPDGTANIGGFALPITLRAEGEIRIEPAVWWPDMGVEVPTSRLRISLTGPEGAFELRAGNPA